MLFKLPQGFFVMTNYAISLLSILSFTAIVTLAATSKRVKTPRGRLRRVFTLSGLFYRSAR